jgi:SAM-dependent methyltransferase
MDGAIMHNTSLSKAKSFFYEYAKDGDKVLEVGSRAEDGMPITYRTMLKQLDIKVEYNGMDLKDGNNVDFVVKDEYNWTEIKDNTYDIVICGQVLEHSEFFWLLFKELIRALKHGGYLCVIVPIKCKIHRFPVDCWRFLPDGMRALAKYADVRLLKAFCKTPVYEWDIDAEGRLSPNDTVGIFKKP